MKLKIEKTPGSRRSAPKQDREYRVLLGLVDYYLKHGKPVGSNTLKDAEFGDLSSATIRNYFAHLEEQGLLIQQHSSGGRIPTHLAYKIYAQEYWNEKESLPKEIKHAFEKIKNSEMREIAAGLQEAAELLSQHSKMAVFLSSPRFDQDFIIDVKFVPIDRNRCLIVIITDFGTVQTELINLDAPLNASTIKKIESYFHWRLHQNESKLEFSPGEEQLAVQIYNELMMRYIVRYSNFIDSEIYKTGFSKLLAFPDFREGTDLANTLALFENSHTLRLLIKDCCKRNQLRFWIGEDLSNYTTANPNCAIITMPYYINQSVVGAVGIVGPTRMPYRELFQMIRQLTINVSEFLTRNIFKFKISFRHPQCETGRNSQLENIPLNLLEARCRN